ncbi:MAG: hypothetical protein KC547_14170, partial [Anaerolineae bacterium]|nr:hypothetical protein [Anaerolineae bacterium]
MASGLILAPLVLASGRIGRAGAAVDRPCLYDRIRHFEPEPRGDRMSARLLFAIVLLLGLA